jgi:catechol 2,3-dioxygenase-like lactoylglutathione lyase family enzyme
VSRSIALVTLVVKDYDEAISFFTNALQFTMVEDKPLGHDKRWVVVKASEGAALLLAKAVTGEQENHVGCQTGGRVAFFLETKDFWHDYHQMKLYGVKFAEEPREEPYGTVAVFFDLYGNKWDLLQRKQNVG